TTTPDEVRRRFAALPEIVATDGDVGLTLDGSQVTLVTTTHFSFGTALLRATGSPEYVAQLEPLPEAPDEAQLYDRPGPPYPRPELRELPAPVEVPELVSVDDIRGDLHCHTRWSDGRATVLEMAEAAREKGYDYLAICDHTSSLGVVPGLDA